jgi:hypothetical protein
MPTRPMNTDRLLRLLAAGDLAVWPDLCRAHVRLRDRPTATHHTFAFRPVMDCAPNAPLDDVLAP